jgi:hypothetical protein
MREHEARRGAAVIKKRFPVTEAPSGFPWSAKPPVKVLDCVLSLNRRYNAFVLPRVHRFRRRHPGVKTCAALRRLMVQRGGPTRFLQKELDYRDAARAAVLVGVLDYLMDTQRLFTGRRESARLRAWAKWARPGDYLTVGVPGFGLAGFQYLRMLFGAATVKPDRHLTRFVGRCLHRRVSPVDALYILERAAELARVDRRQLDAAIWDSAAGQ